jgi:hypothetical protein
MIFSFSVIDNPSVDMWSFSRSNHPDTVTENYWVMPHFTFWSWPLQFIGAVDEVLGRSRTWSARRRGRRRSIRPCGGARAGSTRRETRSSARSCCN